MTTSNDDQVEALARDRGMLAEVEQMAKEFTPAHSTGVTFGSVFFFRDGNMAVCDCAGNQVPAEQFNLVLRHLEQLRDRGLLADDTIIGYLGELLPFEQFRSRLHPYPDIEEQP